MYEEVKVNTLPGFNIVNDSYTVSKYGEVKSNEKQLKPRDNGHGYAAVRLFIKPEYRLGKKRYVNAYVHRLVAMAYIDNPENKPEVDHINCIRDDNRSVNLRWVDRVENMNNPETKKKTSVSASSGKCYVYDFRCKFVGEFDSLNQARVFTGVYGEMDKKSSKYFFLSTNDVRKLPYINRKCKANSIVITNIFTNEKRYFHSNREARVFFSNKINITDAIKNNWTVYGLYKVRNLNYKKLIDSLDL